MRENTKLIFIFLWRQNDWGLYKRRNESLLIELSKRDCVEKVLHIEPITPKRFINLFIKWLKTKDHNLKNAYKLHIKKTISLLPVSGDNCGKIYVYSWVYFASYLFSKLNVILKRIQGAIINKKFFQPGKKTILVVYPPSGYILGVISSIKHDILIADLVDDVIERIEDETKKDTYLYDYKHILPRCDLIFSTSSVISEKYKSWAGREIEFLPNGVGKDEFPTNTVCKLVKNQNRKKVGYVGNLRNTIDMDLLEHLVASFPQADFLLIGFAIPEILNKIDVIIKKYNNCYYLGECIYTDVPHYLSSFDVLINIKKANKMTRGNDSLKIYEYLLTGKPIVSTPVSPANRLEDIIYVASDKLTFAEFLRTALEENNPEMKNKRMQAALENTWDKKVDIILSRIAQLCLM